MTIALCFPLFLVLALSGCSKSKPHHLNQLQKTVKDSVMLDKDHNFEKLENKKEITKILDEQGRRDYFNNKYRNTY